MLAPSNKRVLAFLAVLAFAVTGLLLINQIQFVDGDEEKEITERTAVEQARIDSLKFNLSNYPPGFLLTAAAESTCANSSHSSTFLTVIYIHSQPSHLEQRDFIRNSWFSPHFKTLYNFRVVFILGNPHNASLQRSIVIENGQYRDIVQEDFRDVYQNLTLKEAAALRWTAQYCPSAKFVVKVDDDVVVKPWFFAEILQRKKASKDIPRIFCQVFGNSKPSRDPHSKWYAPTEVYRATWYPRYCSGPIRIMTAEAVPLLLEGIKSVPFLWLEDVYFSGLVAEAVRVERVNEWALVEEHSWKRWFYPKFASLYSLYTALHAYDLQTQRKVWSDIVRNNPKRFRG
ncbi:hypothetical protein RvY_06176 [Ramazzottius varieornatus]|uniref:Hexosyltransferase n=1 Tax=Ramazzottius varieornatus TaxID=947166 RepID=A0A1D1UXM8_RAMVA|nr:hypothetical protein RvY_06176 [Ramazzottius varieornatus]